MDVASPAVATKGLSRRYGLRWALVEITLEVPAAVATIVAGRNGAGKSTLLRILAGALAPSRGAALVAGHDCRTDRDAVRRSTALLSHASFSYEPLTALENLTIAARLLGKPSGRAELLPLLAEVELDTRADDEVATFSAGMRKRLSIARVLLQDAPILLLDEPYNALDPAGFKAIDALVARQVAAGRTVLVASHHVERGAEVCSNAVVLERGRLEWTGGSAGLAATLARLDATRGAA